jgi:hypothetical protein
MRLFGVELRRITDAERKRLPWYAWLTVLGVPFVGVFILDQVLFDDDGWAEWLAAFAVALLVGAPGAFPAFWLAQRDDPHR